MRRLLYISFLVLLSACSSYDWQSILDKSLEDESIDHVLLVKHIRGSKAMAEVYRHEADIFVREDVFIACIGRNGLGKTQEGDGKTPVGEFKVRRAFGIKPDPGAHIEYLQIDNETYACDQDCPNYNQIIHTPAFGGEHMTDYPLQYAYGFELDYNPLNEYPKGSAIFLHCKGPKGETAGCIAIDSIYVKKLIMNVSTGLLVSIH